MAGPARGFQFPSIEKSTLPSGIRVWTVSRTRVPLVAFVLVIARGASSDPPGREGLAALSADMLDEGSGDRSAIDIHRALARIGAQFDTDIGSDGTVVSVTVLSKSADAALALVADIVARPALRESDFDRVRELRLHRLTQLRDSAAAVADRAFLRLIYGDDPYGHSPIGTEAALTATTIDDVRRFHARTLRPSAATLIAVGDCEHERIVRLAGEAFAGWTGVADDAADGSPSPPTRTPLAIVPRPRAPQSELRIGQVSVARNTPDYHSLAVANTILGGQFASRVNLNLRQDKGFTYGARTAFEFRRRPGPFVLQVSVHTAATSRAIEEAIREIAGIRGARPVTEAELALGINALTLGYARNFETAEQIARAVLQLALYDLPDDHYEMFVPRVETVTRDDVSRVMTRYVDPARLTTLVVGDNDAIGGELAQAGLGEPVTLSADAL